MDNQFELFSPAIDRMQKALEALKTLSVEEAEMHLEIAYDIDPYLANIKTYLHAVKCLLELKIDADTQPPELAKAWYKVQTASQPLPPAVYRIVETRLFERILQLLPADYTDFVDAEERTLHVGYCCLTLGRLEEAHKKLLDYLTDQQQISSLSNKDDFRRTIARLWGYFGDAAYRLNRHDESNGGYTRALFMDIHTVDLQRLQHPELRQIFKELRHQYPDETARALLPIHAWLDGVLYIPRGSTWLSQIIKETDFDLSGDMLDKPVQRYQQFALCLFIDQAELHGAIDFEARVEMQRLDSDLFQRYLLEVAKLTSM